MRILIILSFLLAFNTGCTVIGGIQADLLGLEAQPVDICEKENQQCYMEDNESLGICTFPTDKVTNRFTCNNCGECVGCSRTTLGDICTEFLCEVNEREIQANPGDPRRFASLVFSRVLDKKTCDELKGL